MKELKPELKERPIEAVLMPEDDLALVKEINKGALALNAVQALWGKVEGDDRSTAVNGNLEQWSAFGIERHEIPVKVRSLLEAATK